MLWTAGLFVPLIRELRTTRYQFIHPFEVDSSSTQKTLGVAPGDFDAALKVAAAGSGG